MFERTLFVLVAAITPGALCGWLTGRSDPEAIVTAAAIPAILSIAGTLLFWRSMAGDGLGAGGYAVVFLVAFSATIAWGVIRAAEKRDAAADRSVLEAMERRIELVFECSRAEKFVNEFRAKRGQPLLSFHDVCGLGQ